MKTIIALALLLSSSAFAQTTYKRVNSSEFTAWGTTVSGTAVHQREEIPYIDRGQYAEVMCFTQQNAAQAIAVSKADLLAGKINKCEFLVSGVGIRMFGYISRYQLATAASAQKVDMLKDFQVRSSRDGKIEVSSIPRTSGAPRSGGTGRSIPSPGDSVR